LNIFQPARAAVKRLHGNSLAQSAAMSTGVRHHFVTNIFTVLPLGTEFNAKAGWKNLKPET